MRRTLLAALLPLVAWSLPPATASAVTVQLDGGEPLSVFTLLQDGSIELTLPGEAEYVALTFGDDPEEAEDGCGLERGDDGLLAAPLEDCRLYGPDAAAWETLVASSWSESGGGTVLGAVQLVPAEPLPTELAMADGGVSLPPELEGHDAALHVLDFGWIRVPPVAAGGFLDLNLDVPDLGSLQDVMEEATEWTDIATLRTRSPDGVERTGTFPLLPPPGGGGEDGYDDSGDLPPAPDGNLGAVARLSDIEEQDKQWIEHPECPDGPDHRGRGPYVICIDLSGRSDGRPWQTRLPTDDFILRPNRAFVVYVRHNVGEQLEVAMSGDRGLYFAGDKNLTQSAPPGSQSRGETYVPPTVVSRQQFAPRMPGKTDLNIRHHTGDVRMEFTVQPVYIGAIRVGLGMVFLTPEREYTIVTVPGSQTREIALATNEPSSPVAAEIVLGFAPFVFQPHGRGYFGERGLAQRLAPYVGLGLLQTRAEEDDIKFSLLRSIYLGLEVELTATASLAASFVLGRTERLKQPYRVGGPIENGVQEVPTTLGFMPGAAIVINLSPDFLRFTPIKPPSTP